MNWISVEEAAARMGYSRRTLYKWIRSGELRASQKGRSIRIETKAIDEFMRAQEKRSKFVAQSSQPSRPVLVSGALALGGDRFR